MHSLKADGFITLKVSKKCAEALKLLPVIPQTKGFRKKGNSLQNKNGGRYGISHINGGVEMTAVDDDTVRQLLLDDEEGDLGAVLGSFWGEDIGFFASFMMESGLIQEYRHAFYHTLVLLLL